MTTRCYYCKSVYSKLKDGSTNHVPENEYIEQTSCETDNLLESNDFGKDFGTMDGSPKSRKVGPPPLKPGVDYVNPQEEDQMELYGYRRNWTYTVLTWILIIFTGGLLRLMFHWRPQWMLFCTHVKTSLEKAQKVMLVDHYNQIYVENIVCVTGDPINDSKAANEDITEVPCTCLRLNIHGTFQETNVLYYFENKKVRYVWDDEVNEFRKLWGLDRNVSCSYFYKQEGLDYNQEIQRRILYGTNSIVVEVQSILQILFLEVLGPFYIFQICSIILWCLDDYIYYASCIIIMSTLSLGSSVIQIRKNQSQLRDTVQGTDTVTVCRGTDVYEEVESTRLVPGDVITIPPFGCIMQCDAVLVAGNVIVNESMLTGESVPVTKIPLPHSSLNDEDYHSKEHAKHTLFCGTKVLQTRYYGGAKVKAVVIRTGFLTSKGELVRSIMFPKPVDFKFNRHIYRFIHCLAGVALLGFIYTVVIKVQRKVPVKDIIIKALDLITIIIPPALPAAMTIGIVYAQSRLRRFQIYCISPRCINISGCITCVCFDKTGTLTEDDLSFAEIVSVDKDKRFSEPIINPSELEIDHLITCLATCHSLTIIDGNIIGDPLDQKMFESTEWILEEPEVDDSNKYDLLAPTVVKPKDNNENEVGILRQFPFTSGLQRMSVITRRLHGKEFVLYAKGAPEMIASLCKQTTLPDDFSETLMLYTQKGFRVLALAYRELPHLSYAKMQRTAREELENDLTFLGFLVMGNMLKPETKPVIQTLITANIRCIMVTGDNMLTALSVARECTMVRPHHKVVILESANDNHNYNQTSTVPYLKWKYADPVKRKDSNASILSHRVDDVNDVEEKVHVAITGKTFQVLREFYPEILTKVIVRGTVFARMAPEQKQQLVELLQDLGYYVGMCGDGANDCGALKAAHTGISLSETEASVASPFTSKNPNISCVPVLIGEGRAALVTAFGILKYMACYSLAQFMSVILLYTFYTNLTDMQFLYEDLFLISVLFLLFGRTEAFEKLANTPPPSSLIGITPLASLAFQVIFVVAFQLTSVFLLQSQPWYKPHPDVDTAGSDKKLECHDNYAVFAVSVFQYITLAVVFSKGAPFRKPLYTNKLFLCALVILTLITIYIVYDPTEWLISVMEFDLKGVTYSFRLILLGLAFANFILAILAESFIVDYLIFRKLKAQPWFRSIFTKESIYKKIYNDTNSTNWLPVGCNLHQTNVQTSRLEVKKNLRNGFTEGSVSESPKSPPESGISMSISFTTTAPTSPLKTSESEERAVSPNALISQSSIPSSPKSPKSSPSNGANLFNDFQDEEDTVSHL